MVILRFNKTSNEWDEIQQEDKQDGDIYLDGKLRKCLDHYKKQQNQDNDKLLVIEGSEGSGKSSQMGNILEYMSKGEFDPAKDLIGANYLDGLEKIQNAKQGGYLGFDEGNAFFMASETVKKEHRSFHKIFSIFRQKNLFVVICLPSFFRLGTYFALDRSDGLIRTYLKDGKRGFFAFYGKSLKDKLYRIGKKTYDVNCVSPNFRGRFTKCVKMENKEYKSFKSETLSTEIEKAKSGCVKPKTEWQIKKQRDRELIEKNMDYSAKSLGDILGVTERRVQQIQKEIREGISSNE